MSEYDKKINDLATAIFKDKKGGWFGGGLHKNIAFKKVFGEFQNLKAMTETELKSAVVSFVERLKNDKIINGRYNELKNVFELLPSLNVNQQQAIIDLVGPVFDNSHKGGNFKLQSFVNTHYDDDGNMVLKNGITDYLLNKTPIQNRVKSFDIFKDTTILEDEGKNVDMIKKLRRLYETNRPQEFEDKMKDYKKQKEDEGEIKTLTDQKEQLIEDNEDLKKERDKLDDMVKSGGQFFYKTYKNQDDIKGMIKDFKNTLIDDVDPTGNPSPYSHLMNNTRLKRVHAFIDRGYGDMSRDEAIAKIARDLENDGSFWHLEPKDRMKQAESLVDAVFMRKEELSHKYKPVYEKLKTLNDLNMIQSLPEEAAKELNQQDLEKYYADQKRIDKIYILPREWKRVSTATTQYNINPMLLRGIIKE